jgi:hypothetical protein
MKPGLKIVIMIVFLIPASSCRHLKDYFRNPDTETLVSSIQSSILTGFTANLAMTVIEGSSLPGVSLVRSNEGFPCSALMVIDLSVTSGPEFIRCKAGTITIAGLWPDATTAVLSILYSDYNAGTEILDLIGIETIPVMRDGNNITIALADMDIRLNPDQVSLLQVNLGTLEITTELKRLEMTRATDVYVAVTQDAYLIDVTNQGTPDDNTDDDYTITGGGQLIQVAGTSAEIVQVAMVDVQVASTCIENPVSGMALIRTTGLEDEGFPELGTAVLQCRPGCDGTARVLVATGMYAGANGSDVDFHL